jgi:hypothetical protein
MYPARSLSKRGLALKSDCYEAVRAGAAERDSRENQREAVLRLMMPLPTAFPKARLTAWT